MLDFSEERGDSQSRGLRDTKGNATSRRIAYRKRTSTCSKQARGSLGSEWRSAKLSILWIGQVLHKPVHRGKSVRHPQRRRPALQIARGRDLLCKLRVGRFACCVGPRHSTTHDTYPATAAAKECSGPMGGGQWPVNWRKGQTPSKVAPLTLCARGAQ